MDAGYKKASIFYVYNVLKEYSDENHPLELLEIVSKIDQKYGVSCERKAIASSINLLKETLGFDIVKVPKKGTYLNKRTFNEKEASFLVNMLFSNKEISSKDAQRLAEQIYADFSKYQKQSFKYVYKYEGLSRSDNGQFFDTIHKLNTAIGKHKKVKFDYIFYDNNGKVAKSKTVSPFYLVKNNGKYYLVCCVHRPMGLSNLRVDHMENLLILDGENGNANEKAVLIGDVKGCDRDFDIAKYANEKIYMFSSGTVTADILLSEEKDLTYIHDWFGDTFRTKKTDEGIVVTVKSDEKSLVYWLLQYGESAKLLFPPKTVEKVKEQIKKLSEKYEV